MLKTLKEIFLKCFNKNLGCFYQYKAFTLAEVLITLGIIGIIAESTIPTLIQNTNNQENVSRLLKFNSNLQQAVLLWKEDVNCTGSMEYCLSYQGLSDEAFNNFDQIAKFLKYIDKAGNTNNAPWLPKDTLNYYGKNETSNYGKVAHSGCGAGAYLLQDGTTFSIDVDPKGFDVTVDVNGKNPPNRMGKDTFKLRIGDRCNGKDICYNDCYTGSNDNGQGLCGTNANGICDSDNTNPLIENGAMPTSYVILNHKLPDFKELAKTVPGFEP